MAQPRLQTWLWINVKIGALSVGSVSRVLLYEEELVRRRQWLSAEAFREALTLAQILPGPNLVNLSACLGFRLFHWLGAMAAVGLLALPGACAAIILAVAVPLQNHDVTAVFRGFAIGALLLIGGLLWGLFRGIAVDPQAAEQRPNSRHRRKVAGRYLLAGLIFAALWRDQPILPVIATAVVVSLLWEFAL